MTSLPQIDRRCVLRMVVALGTTLAVSKGAIAADDGCGRWLSEDVEGEALQTLGREYVALRGSDEGVGRIAELIAAAESDDTAIAALQELVRTDYGSGRIVQLSHWFVSETEGRIFALLADCAH
jgi:hypothetical protein